MRATRQSRIFEIAFPQARDHRRIANSRTPRNISILFYTMSDKVPRDVGKYLKLSNADEVVGTKKGEMFMCVRTRYIALVINPRTGLMQCCTRTRAF